LALFAQEHYADSKAFQGTFLNVRKLLAFHEAQCKPSLRIVSEMT